MEMDVKEEIHNFCDQFQKVIKSNFFVSYTIDSIIGYLIRRYFYQSDYFKNPNFFSFEEKNSIEHETKSKINDSNKIHNNFPKYEFNEDEFIELRLLYTNSNFYNYLVIHKITLHIFCMKKFGDPISNDSNNHEINFSKYSHRCFVRCYGLIKTKNDKIFGIIYEFMSNGNLDTYIKNKIKDDEDIFLYTTIIRMITGIEYLQKTQQIHRDLKPQNILIDHDYLPYISDFETIKSISTETTNTADISSVLYSSPEQDGGLKVSYPTDIYSFGLIVYFLFEKEDMFEPNKKTIRQMTKGPRIIQYIYNKCIECNPERRITCNEIKTILNDTLYFSEKYFLFESKINLERNESLTIHYSNIFDNLSLFFYFLGVLYEKSLGVKQDYSKSIEYYEKSAELNNSDALNNLGLLYEKGLGVKQDYSKSIEYYEKSAELNNSTALNKLGLLYEKGLGVKQDYSKSIEYYEKSADLNNSYALNNLGHLYEKGLGVKQDYSKSIEYYEKSAELNNSDVLNNLGFLYEKGLGVKQDYSKSIEYYEKSAELNNSTALLYLGHLYEKGLGVKQDYSKSIEYYEKSADLNNSDALLYLGHLYEKGLGVKQDYSKSIEYYEKSAKLNNSNALNNLGFLYEKGLGVKQDYSKSIEYYEKSAKLNNHFSLHKLGIFYKNDIYYKKDYKKAKEYFKKSAKLNYSEAMNSLGDLYESGFGVEQNYEKAMKYYEKSANLNNSDGFLKIGHFYFNGYGVKINYTKGIQYYELSSYLNNSLSHFLLGDIYSNSEIIESDFDKAIKYFEKSISIKTGLFTTIEFSNKSTFTEYKTNNHRYISYNDIGLIYLIEKKEIKKGIDNIKESAFAEYPFGQNNFGLINEFYLNEKYNAEYMYQRSSKHNFSLAEFNLGRMLESENKTEESIEYFVRASEHEDEQLIYRSITRDDKRLKISKKFIICLTNLKLFIYYYSQNKSNEFKKYFIKAFNNLTLNTKDLIYQFNFKISNQQEYSNDLFSYLKKFIFNFPLFNLINQPNLDINLYSDIFEQNKNDYQIKTTNEENKKEIKDPFIFEPDIEAKDEEKYRMLHTKSKGKKNDSNEKDNLLNNEITKINKQNQKEHCESEKEFKDPSLLFDFVFSDLNSNSELKTILINEIKSIIDIMEKILYTPPYPILFGRISIAKPKEKVESKQVPIDESFYEGFGID